MAKELGLNPRSLIKNIPSPTQQWKLPVKQWIHELYEEKIRKTPVNKCRDTQLFKCSAHTASSPIPLHAYADDSASKKNRDNSLQETMTDWQEYVDEMWDDNEPLWLSESSIYREISEENRRTQQRQKDFRLAAEYVAQAFRQISAVGKVMLFGSVATPLQKEKPRYRKYRRTGIPMLHKCKDVDLAVWVNDSGCLRTLQKARSRVLTLLLEEHSVRVAHHQVDVFIMEPDSDRYLGRLCTYSQCPKGKQECHVHGCGSTPLLRQHEDFELNASALTPERSIHLA